MKKAMAQFARTSETQSAKNPITDLSGGRPGKNIEDVERGAIDHLLNSGKPSTYHYDLWKSPLHNIRDYLHHQHPPKPVAPEDVLSATATGPAQETYIDPITNRRTAKYKDLDKYKPTTFEDATQTASTAPQYEDLDKYGPIQDRKPLSNKVDEKPYKDLDKYGPAKDVGTDPAQEKQAEYGDLDKYGPIRWHEPDGLRETTAEEDSKEYDDLHKYSATTLDDPFTQRTLTPEEQSKFYSDLDQYKPVEWNEPDGLPMQSSEELSKNYDDLHMYGPVHWNEPDGLRKLTPEELSKNYTDVHAYGPVVWSEPDGLRRLTPEEESKKYTDLDSYATPFTAPEATLRAYEKASMDRTVKGKPLAAKVEVPEEDLTQKYSDLDLYGPVHWNEPDGLRKLTPEELSKNYDDLHLYSGAFHWHEPDGLRYLTPEEQSKQYRDVPKYAAQGLAPESKWVHPEEASKNYKDLPKYREYDNADPEVARVHPEEASKQYKDLRTYAQYDNSGPDVDPVHPEEASKNYDDLNSYMPTTFDSPVESYLLRPEQAKACQNLYTYTPIGLNVPYARHSMLGDPVISGLKAPDSKAGSQTPENGPFAYQVKENRSSPSCETKSDVDNVDNLTAEDIRAATLRRAREISGSSEAPEPSESKTDLTGIYARDFPEEFTKSWRTEHSFSNSSLIPENQTEAAEEPVAEASSMDAEMSSMDESFPSEDGKLQPALDRHTDKLNMEDSYSHAPQGLETSFWEECGGKETLPTMEHHFAASQSRRGEPELYKILAYDSVTQIMNVAEATSSIHADTTASSPADILIRLSNPSKFLPHFKSLESQGYEIVSGSGDVLVFRKVRDASAEETPATPEPTPVRSMPVNPIDMMGRSAVGSFASPTGFVNYDTLDEFKDKPAPPFRDVSDNTQDEQGVSGAKPGKERKKRRLGRKLALGTVWIAGFAYAVGVMGEYFNARGFEAEARPRRL